MNLGSMNNENFDNEYDCEYDSVNSQKAEVASIYATNSNTRSDLQGIEMLLKAKKIFIEFDL